MPAARRLPTAVGPLLAVVAMTVGGCRGSPPRPAVSSPPSPTSTLTATSSPSGSAPVGDLPALLLRMPLASGFGWALREAEAPHRLIPMQPPTPDAELGPAAPDGRILMAAQGEMVLATVDDGALRPGAAWPLPAGATSVPACFDGHGRPVLADAETLALTVQTTSGLEPVAPSTATLGECAALRDGRTLVSLEGGHLAAIGDEAVVTPVSGALGRHLSGGGGLVAMTDPSSEAGGVVVRHATLSADGALGAEVGRVRGRGTERVVNAQLSPDGGWLALSLEREIATGVEGRLRLFRVDERGLTEVDDVPIPIGTRLTVLPVR